MIKIFLNSLGQVAVSALKLVRTMFRVTRGLLLVGLLMVTLSMTVVPAVYNAISDVVWGAISVFSERYSNRGPTRATPKSDLDAKEADLKSTRASRDKLMAERDLLRNENAQTQRRLRDIEIELETTRVREKTAAQALADARTQNVDLQRKYDLTTQNLQAVQSKQLQTQQSQRDVQQIIGRMQRRSAKMVARNTATVFTDAIPVIGTISVVGGVGWDVWDTCAQLSDISALGDSLDISLEELEGEEVSWCGLSREDLLSIFKSPDSDESKCIKARIRTRTLNPPDCKNFEAQIHTFEDVISNTPDTPATLPEMNDY